MGQFIKKQKSLPTVFNTEELTGQEVKPTYGTHM